MNSFEVIDTVEYSATGAYTIFKINGKYYRIWHYTDDDVKYLQKIDDDFDDVEEICAFH